MFLFLYNPSCHLIFSVSSTWLPHGKKATLLFLCVRTSQGENTQPAHASHFHRQPFSCCICRYIHASIKTFWSIFIFPIYKIIWAYEVQESLLEQIRDTFGGWRLHLTYGLSVHTEFAPQKDPWWGLPPKTKLFTGGTKWTNGDRCQIHE